MTNVRPNDLRVLLMYAARYAIGRQSSAPSDVQHLIRAHIDVLSPDDRLQLATEIRDAPSLGHERIDAPGWLRLAEWLAEGKP